MLDEKILAQLEAADIERAKAYANDLERGLKIVRTYPQGVTIFGSARLPQDNKYCKKARELGQLLVQNGHAVDYWWWPRHHRRLPTKALLNMVAAVSV